MVDTLRVCTSIVEVGDGERVKGQKKERRGKVGKGSGGKKV